MSAPPTRKRNREWLENYKAKKRCERCGESHIACLEFHHRDERTKTATVSSLVNGGASIDRIKAEIRKCAVLCSNCHKIHHFELERLNHKR